MTTTAHRSNRTPRSATRAARRMPTKAARPGTKRRALSVHLGLNAVDPKHYAGWTGDLVACEFDARDMAALAKAAGLKPKVMMTRQATRRKVLAAIRAAAQRLKSGDFFLLTYSGHGGQVDDVSGEEADRLDETWCLFDSQLIDDELYFELSRFAKGVRVIVLSDSCHSGTVTRAAPPRVTGRQRPRMMPPVIGLQVYRQHQGFYDRLQRDVARAATLGKAPVDPDEALANVTTTLNPRVEAIATRCKASVILISGCQDNQTSMDGEHNGAFTERLLRVWDQGAFVGNYARFHAAIRSGMDARQTPNLFTLGPVKTFLKQRPFDV